MKAWLIAAAAAASLSLAGCQPAPPPPVFQATDITGAAFARGFTLTDHNGQTRTLADFKGKAVAMFFGYVHCPDVCPTTLSDFAAALQQLGAQAQQVQVIFVTVDPQRDTPDLLKQFVPAFHPEFLGMYTDAESLKQLAHEYKVVFQKTAVKAPDDYLIDHSAGTYIYDPQGRLRLLMPYGSRPEVIAHDLGVLLAAP
ncbi:MAG: SCO family protein [Thiobacillus sp.]